MISKMKKVMSILVFFILLGNNNLKAHGGFMIADTDTATTILSVIAGVAVSPIISLTPHLVKDNNIHYSYGATLVSTITSTIIIPPIIGGITGDTGIMLASSFIAPIIGTSLGYNYTKSKNENITEKKGEKIIDPFVLVTTIIFIASSGFFK